MILLLIAIYLALVLSIGLFSNRLFRKTGEDYFVASRTIGPFVLLMSLFGTHMTAFSLLGASGEAYLNGIGVFGLMASSSALMVPVVFFFIGTRLWAIGKHHRYLTQVQFFRERWESAPLGLALFLVLAGLMVPYLLIGVMGGGITLNSMTGGEVPQWVGGLLVCAVIFTYVTLGGMRGTAWVNTFQTLVFMVLGAVTFFMIVDQYGGLTQAMQQVREQGNAQLLVRGDKINPWKMLTYTFIPLSVGMFPHIFMHWLSAKSARTFRYPVMFYPLCIAIVWVPSVLLGVLGRIDFDPATTPGNAVLVEMVARHAPGVLGGFLAAGVFAAIMSSLDSQTLALGTMFTQDIVRHYGFRDQLSERQQVLIGRLFVLGILLVTFILAQVSARSIFKLAVWSFSGFSALLPVAVAALFWKRSTAAGAMAAVLSVALLWIYFFVQGWENPGYTVGGTGVMPVAVMFAVSALMIVLVSLLTAPPSAATIGKFFPESSADGR